MHSNTTPKIKEALLTKQNTTNSKSTLSEETKNQILKKLHEFEEKQLFLQKKYTLVSLAKELVTNSAYLSKIINEEKQCNFANYLNQLKINYVVERLKMDTTFRNYTVKAIAETSGFSNTQSFSSSFFKQTGIYPSYFIKQLNTLKTTLNL
ncbi:helix-turn-helix domain-containing protein [Tenacibaculum sp. C7A-26P2]|uniref:helix-turn-helix domain-containing protein n=1 Tax=Tenacibaculum sp. C7A-26P2 TaxID=3447504 RepID=UPI003F84C930